MTAQSAHHQLTQKLSRLRTLLAVNRALIGLGLAFVFLLSAGLCLLILEAIFYLSPILKISLEILSILSLLFIIGYFCVLPFAKPSSLEDLALRVENHFGGLQQQLISALQLWQQRDREGHSSALVDAAIVQAHDATERLAFEKLIDRKLTTRAAATAIVLALLGLFLHLGWPNHFAGAARIRFFRWC